MRVCSLLTAGTGSPHAVVPGTSIVWKQAGRRPRALTGGGPRSCCQCIARCKHARWVRARRRPLSGRAGFSCRAVRRAHTGTLSGRGPIPMKAAGSAVRAGTRRTRARSPRGGSVTSPLSAGAMTRACAKRCTAWTATVGKVRRRCTRARKRLLPEFLRKPRARGRASRRAAATASCTARLMPTPPTGDMAWAASPMHSTPGACQRRRRSMRTSRCLTSSIDAIPETSSASSGIIEAVSARRACTPRARSAASVPFRPMYATCA